MISPIDTGIIIAYLALVLLIGYHAGKRNENQEDYFLAGRSMPWIPVALSVAATMVSANGFVGGPGWAYQDGMYPVMVNITVPLAIFFACWVTTPVVRHLGVTSVYQYMEKRLGGRTKLLTIAQFLINSLIQVSSMVYIPVLIIHTITGWPVAALTPLVVLVAIVYTLMGGIRAVIWTDAIQMVVVVGGVVLIVATALNGIGLGFFDTMRLAKEAGKLNTLDFSTSISGVNTFWATLIGGGVMWVRYFCFDQSQVQRVLTAKSVTATKNSFVVSAVLMNLVYYFMLLVGVLLFLFYGGKPFDTSNEIMIGFILQELPVGIVGIVIAGVLAAAMSSVDSILNSMAAVFTKDIYEPYFAKKREEATLGLTKRITVAIGAVVILFILIGFSGTARSVLDLVGSYISYFSGPAAGAFLLAMFTRKANDKGVSAGFVIGLVGGFAIASLFSVGWVWNPAIGAAITLAAGYLLSLALPGGETGDRVRYTAQSIHADLKAEKTRGKAVALPFQVGVHEVILLLFFLAQYAVLLFIQYK